MSFVNLHLHSSYSILDGAIRYEALADRLVELGMNACALTDHGFMGGILEFQKALEKKDIKPLLGVEAYITEDPDGTEKKTRDNEHLVLIAKTDEGLRRLMTIQAEAANSNFYYKPRIHRQKLEELGGHVIVSTACLKGILSCHMDRDIDPFGVVQQISCTTTLLPVLEELKRIFGDDLYLEVQAWDDETHIQSEYNKAMMELAATHSLPLVITNDCHYLTREDHAYHEMMMAMQFRKTIDDYQAGDVMRYGNFFHVHSPAEMQAAATEMGCPEATQNTVDAAAKCNTHIETGIYHLPVYKPRNAPDYEDFIRWQHRTALEPANAAQTEHRNNEHSAGDNSRG